MSNKQNHIKPAEKLDELLSFLDRQELITYTAEDEGFDYLEDGQVCIGVLNAAEGDDLFIDLQEDFTVAFGDWTAQYEPDEEGFAAMCREVKGILNGTVYIAVVYVREDWICSLSVDRKEIRRAELLARVRDFLHTADCDALIDRIQANGASIHCSWWMPGKERKIRVRAGEF